MFTHRPGFVYKINPQIAIQTKWERKRFRLSFSFRCYLRAGIDAYISSPFLRSSTTKYPTPTPLDCMYYFDMHCQYHLCSPRSFAYLAHCQFKVLSTILSTTFEGRRGSWELTWNGYTEGLCTGGEVWETALQSGGLWTCSGDQADPSSCLVPRHHLETHMLIRQLQFKNKITADCLLFAVLVMCTDCVIVTFSFRSYMLHVSSVSSLASSCTVCLNVHDVMVYEPGSIGNRQQQI